MLGRGGMELGSHFHFCFYLRELFLFYRRYGLLLFLIESQCFGLTKYLGECWSSVFLLFLRILLRNLEIGLLLFFEGLVNGVCHLILADLTEMVLSNPF